MLISAHAASPGWQRGKARVVHARARALHPGPPSGLAARTDPRPARRV